MSYLKSQFITPYGRRSLKPQISGSFYQGNVDSKDQDSINSRKPGLLNLFNFYQDGRQQALTKTKEKPLILFVNLLMKDGKKTQALRVLSMTLSLLKARISKIKLEKHSASLKDPRKSVYQSIFNPLKGPWQNTFFKNFASNYSIKRHNCYVVFSKKSHIKYGVAQSPSLSFYPFPPFFKYRKIFPFISNFCFLFDEFYARKRFFCGKFINLKQLDIIKKNKQYSKTLSLVVDNIKTKKTSGDPSVVGPKDHRSDHQLDQALVVRRTNASIKKKEKQKDLGRGDSTGLVISKLKKITFIVNPFRIKQFLDPKSYSSTKTQRANKNTLVNSKGCLWYKTITKNPSWQSLTSAQKNSFLFCLYKAISNVKPPLECRTKRIGGSNKQIPSQVSEHRQWGLAIRWIIEAAQYEFSKRKNKSLEHKEIFRPHLNHSLENSRNVQDKSKFPRGVQSYLGLVKENKSFISSSLQRRPKVQSLKNHSPKTKFYYFCFFLAESLENAYYKRGPAMQKRNLWVDTALANRAFLRYRWW